MSFHILSFVIIIDIKCQIKELKCSFYILGYIFLLEGVARKILEVIFFCQSSQFESLYD